jgi:hypothetical protein
MPAEKQYLDIPIARYKSPVQLVTLFPVQFRHVPGKDPQVKASAADPVAMARDMKIASVK